MKKVLSSIGISFLIMTLFAIQTYSQNSNVINHENTSIESIPDNWIDSAKQNLNIFYGRTSFGEQLTNGGMKALTNYSPAFATKYAFNASESSTSLTIVENEYDLSMGREWISTTANFLASHAECNVVMWSWDSIANQNVTNYLTSMDSLIKIYGEGGSANRANPVTFVFMNAHSVSGVNNENTYLLNERIREYCIDSGRVFYDFADIESWDPNGLYYGDGNPTEGYFGFFNLNRDCSYDLPSGTGRGNWGTEWITNYPTHFYSELAEETNCSSCYGSDGDLIIGGDNSRLQCVLKGMAAWQLWAKLAGWQGSYDTVATLNNVTAFTGSGNDLSTDTIFCDYNLTNNSTSAGVTWKRNGSSIMSLHLPFEGGRENSLLDISGNNNNVRLEESVAQFQPFWVSNGGVDSSGAYQFLGDDYIIADNGFPSGSSYTKSAWFKVTANGPNHIISGSVTGITHTLMVTTDNTLMASHHSSIRMTEDSEEIDFNTWYHAAVTFDYDSRILILYKNGTEVSRDTISFTYRDIADTDALIGSLATSFNFNGLIDEVGIFNIALSPEQINSIYMDGFKNITPQETSIGDSWQAIVTPFSNDAIGRSDTAEIVYIEAPEATDISLISSSGGNTTEDSLICNYNLNSLATTTAVNWIKNGESTTTQFLPFEGGVDDALLDISGNNNSAKLEGVTSFQPTWNASSGHDGNGAYSFDGGDYLIGGKSFPTESSYTKTIWINRSVNGNQFIMAGSQTGTTHILAVSTDSTLYASHNTSFRMAEDSEKLEMNTWYFVAVTFNYDDREMILYKDGVEVARNTITPTYQNITDTGVFIGAIATNYNFSGILDDSRIYNYALSPEQILSLYNTNSILVPEETTIGDVWQAEVTAFSDITIGATKASNVLEIEDARISSVTLTSSSGENRETDTLVCNVELNAVATTSAVNWLKNGEPIMNMYLPFEGGDSNAYKDMSGNNNHASFDAEYTNPTWSSNGGHDGHGAYTFDGNDFLVAGDILPISGSYTKSAWINISANSDNNIISGTSTGLTHMLTVSDDSVLFASHHTSFRFAEDSEKLNHNTWYFVAVSFDYASKTMCLYKNGVEVDRTILSDPYLDLTDGEVLIGAVARAYEFNGNIDDPRIYNYALSGEQINALYQSGSLIVPQETASGDVWQSTATPFSIESIGDTVNSAKLSIGMPQLSNATLTLKNSINPLLDSIICDYTSNIHVTNTAVNWYRNDSSIMSLYLPFEGGDSANLYDVSGSDSYVTLASSIENRPNWEPNSGFDGNGAFDFDGNDYINAGAVFPDSSSYTKVAWINYSEAGYNNIISGSVIGESHWFRVNGDSTLIAGHHTSIREITSPGKLLPNTWYFVALSYDLSSREIILYVNGTEVTRATVNYIYRMVQDSSVFVGSFAGDNSYSFHGTLDDVRIYNRALSPEQINQLYTSSKIIVPEETNEDEEWQAVITPFSSSAMGKSSSTNLLSMGLIQISTIPNQIINEGGTFTDVILDNYVEDCCYHDSLIQWSVTGQDNLIVQLIDSVPQVARILTPDENYYSYVSITFHATDPANNTDSIKADFVVLPINDTPEFIDTIANDTINEGENFDLISLNSYVFDVDDHINSLVWTTTGETHLNVTINQTTKIATVTPLDPDWFGRDTIQFVVTDTSNASSYQDVIFIVNPINDAPTAISLSPDNIDEDAAISTLVGVLSATDVDDDSHIFTLVEDNSITSENNLFKIANSNELFLNAELDYSVSTEHIIAVQADDSKGGIFVQAITVTVNEAGQTGIDFTEEFSFMVYPNPSNGLIHIDKSDASKVSITIFNIVGKTVYSESFYTENKEMDLNHLPAGIYYLNIKTAEISKTIQIELN